MNHITQRAVIVLAMAFLFGTVPRAHGDWPMWRHDAARTASTEETLPENLTLHWSIQLPTPRPAWPAEQGKVRFDASYEPVAAGGRFFVPSMVLDCVTAYDVTNGTQLWRFFANGPVRFAPIVHGDRLLFVADDGYLYCLETNTGKLLWNYRGGPADRWLLGNDRLISMWPARGAPVVYEDTVYFASGIWPFMGTFIHAVDIATGKPLWTNSATGSDYVVQQHNSPAFAGVAPQGYLAANDQILLVAGGMTVPAAFDRKTGQLLFFRLSDRDLGKDQGGYEVFIGPGWFCNRGSLFDLSDGTPRVKSFANILTPEGAVGVAGKHLVSVGRGIERTEKSSVGARGKKTVSVQHSVSRQWRVRLPEGIEHLHLRAGNELLVSDLGGRLLKLAQPTASDAECRVTWSGEVDGTIWRMLVSNERLFVVTLEGAIYCFGANDQSPNDKQKVIDGAPRPEPQKASTEVVKQVSEILSRVKQRDGYAVVEGDRGMAVATVLAAQSRFHILLFQADAKTRRQWREQLAARQLLGTRVAVVPGTLADTALAPYFAEIVIGQRNGLSDSKYLATLENGYAILRPYGGTVFLGGTASARDAYAEAFSRAKLRDRPKRYPKYVAITRSGPLPGAGSWTCQNGDPGNTVVSSESNVKAPLGLLWFGGPSNRDVLPRHGHGPTPQVIGGRLFIEGRDMLRAVDVYTGRLLWQREFKDVGIFYDNTDHHPGAGAIGGNFVTTRDSVYLVWGRRCLRLDPATGKTLREFHLPRDTTGEKPYWGYIAVYGDSLVAGSTPMALLTRGPRRSGSGNNKMPLYSQFGEGSHRLVVMDRFSGEVRWKRDAIYNFRHNAIALGDDKLFCLDRITEKRLEFLRRRGEKPSGQFCLYALDLQTGETLWQSTEHVFGTWLAYESQTKLLLQAGSKYRDRAADEIGTGMAVHNAVTGELLWRNQEEYGGPLMLYPDKIITQGTAIDLRTGKRIERTHPLTGERLAWKFQRNYGCGTAVGCVNLLTFRSAAAGYFDLANDGGTGNFGGFRASCTSNLLPADGVLNAPDYTRTCTCSYQNQCSLALIHMPDVETWTFNAIPSSAQRVKRLGINFGAPGDRRAEDGTYWLDYPSVGGSSPDVPVTVSGPSVYYTRKHSLLVDGPEPRWVFGSGVHGARTIRIRVAGSDAASGAEPTYRVRLYLSLPVRVSSTEAVSVRIQGKTYNLRETVPEGEGMQGNIVREFNHVPIAEHLELDFVSNGTGNDASIVVRGVEIQTE